MKPYKQHIIRSLLGSGVIALMAVGLPVHAMEPGNRGFQVYGGWYTAGELQNSNDVDSSLQDTMETLGLEPGDGVTFGARIGQNGNDTFGWEFSAGFFDIDEIADRLENQGALDMSLGLYDASLMFCPVAEQHSQVVSFISIAI